MNTPIRPRQERPGRSDPVADAVLDVRDLRIVLQTPTGEVEAVRDLSFDIRPGEVVSLVGESGSGKSLTALAIMGLLPEGLSRVEGSVALNGTDLLALKRDAMARVRGRDISMIFQEPMTALDPVFRIGEQIAESARRHRGLGRKAAGELAIELLDAVGIPDARRRASSYPHQLSGGMRQRVMIAIALVAEPSVLIADEPTTALDVTIQAQILDLLRTLADDHDTGVLLITHDLGVVAETSSRVNTIYAGEIVEQRPVDALLRRPRHPYTAGLIAAIPRIERRKQALYSIPGRVPGLDAMPGGCRFRARCDYAALGCEQQQVLESDVGGAVRCHRAPGLDLTRRTAGE